MSDPRAVLLAALDALESGPFDYVLYGGMASGLWGEPRFTADANIVLFLHEREAPRFLRAAARFGFAVDEDLAIQQVRISGWCRLPLGVRDSPWHLDMCLGDTEFDRNALSRRREARLFDRAVWVASPEDLILYKLLSARDQDLLDAKGIGRRQKGALDGDHLRRWADWWEREGVREIRARVETLLGTA